jgi:hypothetical protein
MIEAAQLQLMTHLISLEKIIQAFCRIKLLFFFIGYSRAVEIIFETESEGLNDAKDR